MSGGQEDSDGKRVGLKLRNALSLSDRGGGPPEEVPVSRREWTADHRSVKEHMRSLKNEDPFNSSKELSVTNLKQGAVSSGEVQGLRAGW